jgi:hypothetical protein
VGDFLCHHRTEPFPKLDNPLLVAGGTEVPALTGKGQKILMTAISTPHPSKTVMTNPTVKISIDNPPHIGSEKPILLGKAFIIDLIKSLKVVLNRLIVL